MTQETAAAADGITVIDIADPQAVPMTVNPLEPAPGISPPLRLRHAAQMMGAGGHGRQPGWLEVVLSWPQRIIGPDPSTPPPAEEDLRRTGTG